VHRYRNREDSLTAMSQEAKCKARGSPSEFIWGPDLNVSNKQPNVSAIIQRQVTTRALKEPNGQPKSTEYSWAVNACETRESSHGEKFSNVFVIQGQGHSSMPDEMRLEWQQGDSCFTIRASIMTTREDHPRETRHGKNRDDISTPSLPTTPNGLRCRTGHTTASSEAVN